MKVRLTATALLAVAYLAPSRVWAADCESWNGIGRVEEVSDEVKVSHAGGPAVSLQVYAAICRGDRFEFPHGGKVTASFLNVPSKVFDQSNPKVPDELAVGPEANSQWSTSVSLFVTQLTRKMGRFRPVVQFNTTRDVRLATLTPDPLLQPGSQFLPAGYNRASFLWDGGPGFLKLQPDMGGIVKSGRMANVAVDLPGDASPIVVSPMGQTFHWEVRRSDAVPKMPELSDEALLTPAGRTARALWILARGPKEWQLFALSELSSMAAAGSYLADELWTAARSGQLAELIAGSSTSPHP